MKKATTKKKAKKDDDGRAKFVILRYAASRYTDPGYYWVFIAENGEVVAVSEMYRRSSDARKGIASLRANAATARVMAETTP